MERPVRMFHRFSAVVLISTLPLLLGCDTLQDVLTPAESTAPVGVPEVPRSIRWVADSAEYRAALIQAYRFAALELEKRVVDLEPGTWTVSLDTDETTLSNAQYEVEQAEAGLGFTRDAFAEWVGRREAPALPGVLTFLEGVRELGGRIVVVTNRWEALCPDTEANYRAVGISVDVVLCGSGEKEPRYQRVEDGTAAPDLPPLEIVMWIGDNIQDFPDLDQDLSSAGEEAFSEFGTRFIVLPNPMYGSWDDS
jgi:5'-nucleotidase (lipoprotein e(P4) family)